MFIVKLNLRQNHLRTSQLKTIFLLKRILTDFVRNNTEIHQKN